VRLVEEVTVGGVVAGLEHGRALVLPGVAALGVVEVLEAGDREPALAAAGKGDEHHVDVAAGAAHRHRVGGGLEAPDRRRQRGGGVVERCAGHEEPGPGEAAVVGAAAADPGLGRGHRQRRDVRDAELGQQARQHDVHRVQGERRHLGAFAETLVVRHVHRPVVVEEGEQVVGVAGRDRDGGLDLALQVAVALEEPVEVPVVGDHRQHVDVLVGLLRRSGDGHHRQEKENKYEMQSRSLHKASSGVSITRIAPESLFPLTDKYNYLRKSSSDFGVSNRVFTAGRRHPTP
jgi:hypothetical protein